MSYSEQNGRVILDMSREDYQKLMFRLGKMAGETHWRFLDEELCLVNRINEGNPNFTPYQVPK